MGLSLPAFRSLALFLVIVTMLAFLASFSAPSTEETPAQLKKFNSAEELKSYLNASSQAGSSFYGLYGSMNMMRSASMETMGAAEDSAQKSSVPSSAPSSEASDFSQTNVQVQGVDEADFAKNDGKYIYVIHGRNITIIDAYPASEGRIVSDIEFSNATPSQIFINGDRLAVFGSIYSYYDGPVYKVAAEGASGAAVESVARYPYYQSSKTFINIYDISDRSNPILVNNYTIDGDYYNSRMIGDYIYLITNQAVYNYAEPAIPEAAYRCVGISTGCFNVWYFDSPDYNHHFTIVSSLNIKSPSEPNSKVFVMGYTQNLYVSQENIYVVYTKYLSIYDFFDRYVNLVMPMLPGEYQGQINEIKSSTVFSNYEKMSAMSRVVQNYSSSLSPEERLNFQKQMEERSQQLYEEIQKEMEKTIIHKISISEGNIEYKTQGEVPGNTLNQFSMDEFGGNFRIATTSDNWRTTSKNHVYILDSDLKVTGRLEDLASGERIYSVRFLGEKGYLVTFRQIDPLYVIDLSNPAEPKVLGFLKIPGVSDYLHPYDETHIIGVGRDASDEGRIKGMKISLFDVSDVQNPKEISTYFIGKRGTYSEAINDHKAFLFSREKNLLVIPVTEATDEDYYTNWMGAYVFNLDLENGFVLKGRVNHMNQSEIENKDRYYYYYDYNSQIRRSLYMDDVLYTISGRMVKANSLSDLSELNKIDIPVEEYYPRYYGIME